MNGDRSVGSMQRSTEVVVAFQALEVWENALPSPAGRTGALPIIVVIGPAAQRPHAHDGRAASHAEPLWKWHRGGGGLASPMDPRVRPHVGRVECRERKDVAHIGGLLAGAHIAARLDEDKPRVGGLRGGGWRGAGC